MGNATAFPVFYDGVPILNETNSVEKAVAIGAITPLIIETEADRASRRNQAVAVCGGMFESHPQRTPIES